MTKRTLNDQFMLRMPDGMRDRLKQVAAVNGRSMNAEIVHRLEASLVDPNKLTFDATPPTASSEEPVEVDLRALVSLAKAVRILDEDEQKSLNIAEGDEAVEIDGKLIVLKN